MDALAPLTHQRFTGIAEFEAAVALFLAHAKQEGWQRLQLCDPDFSLWPLGRRAYVEALDAWSQSGRECLLLAADFRHIQTDCPRWVAWRVQWQHIITALSAAPPMRSKMPRCMISPAAALILLDPDHRRGFITTDAQHVRELQEVVNEVRHSASPAFPPTTLGL